MRRRASATATFSLPWKYLLAVSEDIAILTLGSQSTSSDHSQCRLPSSPSEAARMFTTRSRSVNSKRWGTSASRSFGPMSGSSSIIEHTASMTSTNSSSELNSAFATLQLPVPAPLDAGDRRRGVAGLGLAGVPVFAAAVAAAVGFAAADLRAAGLRAAGLRAAGLAAAAVGLAAAAAGFDAAAVGLGAVAA